MELTVENNVVVVSLSVDQDSGYSAAAYARRAEAAEAAAVGAKDQVATDRYSVSNDRSAVEVARADVEEKAGIAEQAAVDALDALSNVSNKYDKQQVFSPVPENPNSRAIIEAFFSDYDDAFEYFIDIFYRQHPTQGTRLRIQKRSLEEGTVSVYHYLDKGMGPVSGKRVEKLADATLLIDWDVIPEGGGSNLYSFKFSNLVSNIDNTLFLKSLFLETEIENVSQDISAIYGVVYNIFNALEQIATVQLSGVNLIEASNVENGYFNSFGNPAASDNYRRTKVPIPVFDMENNIYTYEGYLFTANCILLYDAQMTRIQVIVGSANLYTVNINDRVTVDKSTVAYMHLSSVATREMKLFASETNAALIHGDSGAGYATEGMMGVLKSTTTLQITNKHDLTKDLYILFEKCMYNLLFTYKQVAYMPNTSPDASLDFTRAKTNIVTTGSDNIGPYSINGGGWTGGNHSYAEGGTVKTAETLIWTAFADGKPIKDGDVISAKRVTVKVRNAIYDPRVAPAGGATILNTLLCYEDVVYEIENGDISVSVIQTWQSDAVVGAYYGQQTVCALNQYMTSSGNSNAFIARTSATPFIKSSFPNFDRFIQRKTDKSVYESVWLNTFYKLGTHSNISGDRNIANTSTSKLYHNLMAGTAVVSGQITGWNGLYSWKIPIKDTTDYVVFEYTLNGKIYLAIDVLNVFNGYIDLLGLYSMTNVAVLKKSDSVTFVDTIVDSIGLRVTTNGYGAVYIELPTS